MQSKFGSKVASLGGGRKHEGNYERDFMRHAWKELGVAFQLHWVETQVRCMKGNVTKMLKVGMLLPHELAHLLWIKNRNKFEELFCIKDLQRFWEKTIAVNEDWFQNHPLNQEIRDAEDKTKYLPFLMFGDDGTMAKTRVMKCMTWHCALHSKFTSSHSRMPFYVVPQHLVIDNLTEQKLQETIVWAFQVWTIGRFSFCDQDHKAWTHGSAVGFNQCRRQGCTTKPFT